MNYRLQDCRCARRALKATEAGVYRESDEDGSVSVGLETDYSIFEDFDFRGYDAKNTFKKTKKERT